MWCCCTPSDAQHTAHAMHAYLTTRAYQSCKPITVISSILAPRSFRCNVCLQGTLSACGESSAVKVLDVKRCRL